MKKYITQGKTMNETIPCDKAMDSSMALMREGYEFIQNRCRDYRSDIFLTRLMGQKVVCISGEEAAKIFYDNTKFKRKGAAPKRVQKTLFGMNGVQGLDGRRHKHRKFMFMSIMTPYNIKRLQTLTWNQWEKAARKWTMEQPPFLPNKKQIHLFDEAQEVLIKVACIWAGVPLMHSEVRARADDLGKLVDGFGGVGIRYYEGRFARLRTEKWIKDIITGIRNREIKPAKSTAAYIIAWHKDLNGKLLSTQVAAVELINILRPIVAIATYITFGALAMIEHPEYRMRLRRKEEHFDHIFCQEVRRYYPFTPFVGAIVKTDFTWNHYLFRKDTLVLLDVYGIDHDSRLWIRPYEFMPERFLMWNGKPFGFIPQGGGDYYEGHRCPGEMVAVEIMKASLTFLADLEFTVPKQNLDYKLNRIPTLPKSRFIISNISYDPIKNN